MQASRPRPLRRPRRHPRTWLRRLVDWLTAPDTDRRLPSDLAHLDDRLLRDIGLDPQRVRREMPLESLVTIERWYVQAARTLQRSGRRVPPFGSPDGAFPCGMRPGFGPAHASATDGPVPPAAARPR